MVVSTDKSLLHYTLQCHIQLLNNIEIIFQTIRYIPHLKDSDAYSSAEIIQTYTQLQIHQMMKHRKENVFSVIIYNPLFQCKVCV